MRFEDPTVDGSAVLVFKDSQARAEELAAGHNHDVKAWRDVISSENLSNQSFSTISDHRTTQPLRGGDAQPTDSKPIGLAEQRVIAAWKAGAMLVDVLELGVSADPLAWAELQALVAADS